RDARGAETVRRAVADGRAHRAHHRDAKTADRSAAGDRARDQFDRGAVPGEDAEGPLRGCGRPAAGSRSVADRGRRRRVTPYQSNGALKYSFPTLSASASPMLFEAKLFRRTSGSFL